MPQNLKIGGKSLGSKWGTVDIFLVKNLGKKIPHEFEIPILGLPSVLSSRKECEKPKVCLHEEAAMLESPFSTILRFQESQRWN